MENAAEALKIAFAVMMFVMALTLSVSSFSQANEAVQAITTLRDRESEYTYVTPTEDLSRTVGIETVVSAMYRSYNENTIIYFYESDETTPISLYYSTNAQGDLKKDDYGNEIEISCIDLSTGFGDRDDARQFLDILLGGIKSTNSDEIKEKYEKRLIPEYKNDGLYEKFKDATFKELLGEYEEVIGVSKTTKRIITFIKQ